MTVIWARRALSDLASLHSYLGGEDVEIVPLMVDRLYAAGQSLEHFPERGRAGRVKGTRELVLDPYVITYRVHRDSVRILSIEHGAKRR